MTSHEGNHSNHLFFNYFVQIKLVKVITRSASSVLWSTYHISLNTTLNPNFLRPNIHAFTLGENDSNLDRIHVSKTHRSPLLRFHKWIWGQRKCNGCKLCARRYFLLLYSENNTRTPVFCIIFLANTDWLYFSSPFISDIISLRTHPQSWLMRMSFINITFPPLHFRIFFFSIV